MKNILLIVVCLGASNTYAYKVDVSINIPRSKVNIDNLHEEGLVECSVDGMEWCSQRYIMSVSRCMTWETVISPNECSERIINDINNMDGNVISNYEDRIKSYPKLNKSDGVVSAYYDELVKTNDTIKYQAFLNLVPDSKYTNKIKDILDKRYKSKNDFSGYLNAFIITGDKDSIKKAYKLADTKSKKVSVEYALAKHFSGNIFKIEGEIFKNDKENNPVSNFDASKLFNIVSSTGEAALGYVIEPKKDNLVPLKYGNYELKIKILLKLNYKNVLEKAFLGLDYVSHDTKTMEKNVSVKLLKHNNWKASGKVDIGSIVQGEKGAVLFFKNERKLTDITPSIEIIDIELIDSDEYSVSNVLRKIIDSNVNDSSDIADQQDHDATTKGASELMSIKRVSASSQYPADRSSYYPSNAVDADNSTAWFPKRTQKANKGEWIMFEFDKHYKIQNLSIINGWIKNNRVFNLNSRIKNAFVELSNGTKVKIELQDVKIKQVIDLGGVSTKSIKIIIDDIYPGNKWNQEAGITDVYFNGKSPKVNY